VRPVNLIPGDLGRGARGSNSRASTGYVVIAAMALLLLGVFALVSTNNQISDRESEIARLEVEERQAAERAQRLSAFTAFRSVEELRTATVASLAQSRFDWERVMRELSLVIPDSVWLVNLTGTVSSEVTVENEAGVASRDSVEGPAVEIVGCATTQDQVAGFVSALEDIDGVTRVGIQSSARGDAGGDSTGSGDTCRTRDFIYQFEIVIAFDAVPTPPTATEVPTVPAPTTPESGQPASVGG
jgi:Tfp pilus assembly protein PilN